MSGSFVKHSGPGKTFPGTPQPTTPVIWTEDQMRNELKTRGIWTSSLPCNVECWYPQVLAHVKKGTFTFEEFADTFASKQPFDFGSTINRLLSPGGWYDEAMS